MGADVRERTWKRVEELRIHSDACVAGQGLKREGGGLKQEGEQEGDGGGGDNLFVTVCHILLSSIRQSN